MAPILCENLDGYCATINNNNVVQTFPGCPGWQLNNDEWFAFFAGSTSINIQITPYNCTPGGQQGLQGAIYAGCGPPWVAMDLQCACTTNPFQLNANNFVIGQIYYIVLDGCAGNVCDYSVSVLSGSTVGVAPNNPGPISGPMIACQSSTTSYNLAPVTAATIYTWSVTPAIGTVTGTNNNASVNWSGSGTAQVCVNVSNLCYSNPTPSCTTVEVVPTPTATLSGSGLLCAGTNNPVNLTVTFTGTGPWTFVHTIAGVPQPPITTSTNPYTLQITQPGMVALQSVVSVTGNCNGTVSGNVNVPQITLAPSSTTTAATCGSSNGSIDLSVSGGNMPYIYNWSNGASTQDLTNVPGGSYTVTITENNGCTATYSVNLADDAITLNVTGTTVANTTCTGGNGSVSVSVTPAGSYTYNWSNGGTTPSQTNLTPGTYTVTVTAGVTCTQTASFTIADQPNNPSPTTSFVAATCGQSNGSASVNVTGGVAPYTYNWSNGSSGTSISNVPGGTYTVTVTGANGCTATASATVPDNPINFNVSGTTVANTTCTGGNGSISITVNPAGTYTYNWSNGGTGTSITNLTPGTYSVTVTTGVTCTQVANFNVPDQPNTPSPSTSFTAANCGLSNGSASVNVTGGVSPYSYNWSNGSSGTSISNVPGGTYTVTVTGANGCTATASVTVPDNPIVFNVSGTTVANTTCTGGNGSVNINVTPAGSYTYTWSNGASGTSLTNLTPGTYTVTVSAGGNCTQVSSFTVADQPNTPNATPSFVAATCGQSNGTASVNVTGGVSPYTYNWSNGSSGTSLTNVPGGSYTVTVTGANGCTTVVTANVPDNPIVFNVNGTTNPNTTCNGNNNGSVNINVTPAGSYTITWSNGASGTNLTNLAPGTYSVTVSAGGNCTQVASFTVANQPNLPIINQTVNPATCGLSNGSASISVSGGVPAYTYNWSNGNTTTSITGVPGGTYSVTVTAGNGCTATAAVSVPDNPVNFTVNGTTTANTSCNSSNGSVSISVTPSGTYTYNWSTGATGVTSINNLSPGSYTVTVSAGGTCTAAVSFTVGNQPQTPNLTGTTTAATCGLPNGSATVTTSGAPSPFIYSWSNGSSSPTINNVPGGTYTVTVTAGNGCTATTSVTVPDNPIPITITPTIMANTSCAAGNGSISISVTPTMGISYQWSTGSTASTITGLAPGSYSVTVNAGGTCTQSAVFNVPSSTSPPNLSLTATPATCGLSNGGAQLNISGGSAPFTIVWSNGSTSSNLSNVPAGNYSVTVLDAVGCQSIASVTVPNNDLVFSILPVINDNTDCTFPNGLIALTIQPPGNYTYLWANGQTTSFITDLPAGVYSVTVSAGGYCTSAAAFPVYNNTTPPTLTTATTAATCGLTNGAVNLTATGPNQPFTYIWSNGATTEDLNNVPSGTYTVTVTGNNGCSSTASANVVNNTTALNASGTATPNTSCTSNNGAVTLTVTPAGSYTYTWSNGATAQNLSNLAPGSYTVTVSAGGTCSTTASFTIANNATPPNLASSTTASTCQLSNGAATLTISGGTTPYTFNWSNGATTQDLNNVASGSYSVTVTGANGCSATTSVNVANNNIALNLSGTPAANTSCTSPNGSLTLTVTPPGSYTYTWSSGATSQNLNNVAAGNYTVTVSAGGSCTATATYVVGNNTPTPTIANSINPAICGDNSGAIDLTVSSGVAPYSYLWSNGATTEDLNTLLSGDYTVTVTDANGCSASATLNVPNNSSSFSLSGTPSPINTCIYNNGSINLSITPAGSYTIQWSNGANTEDLDSLSAGTYTVTVTEAGACSATASFIITNQTTLPTTSQQVSAEVCGLVNGAIDLSVSGGTLPYTYTWSNGATTEDLSNVPNGAYTVTVTAANGCSAITSANVPENTISFSLNGITAPNASCDLANGSITLSVTPPGSYTYTWSNGASSQSLNGILGGNYSVTVSAGGTCTNVASFNVGDVTASPEIAQNIVSDLCAQNTGSIDLTVSGSEPPYTFQWSNGATTDDLSGLAAGNFSVTVTGNNGCATTESFTVPPSSIAINLSGTPSPNTSCVVNNGGVALSVSPPGSYTYTWSNGSTLQNLAGVSSGGYSVTVSAGGNCTAEASFNVPSTTADPVVSQNVTPAVCGLDNGGINLSVTGGLAPYTFVWSNGSTSEDLSALLAGTYTVTVTGANGCNTVSNITVPSNSITFTVTGTTNPNTSCDMSDGTVNVTVTPAGSYTYTWSNGASVQNPTGLAPGTYTVTVSAGGSCTSVNSFTVGNASNAPTVAQIITAEVCGNGTGAINLSATGGTMPYTFQWSNGASTEDLSGLSAGNYSVTVIGADGCSTSLDFTVNNNVLQIGISGTPTHVLCFGQNTGSINLSISGGNTPYTLQWTPAIPGNPQNPQNLAAGNYTVLVTDVNGCSNTESFTVNSPESALGVACSQTSNVSIPGGNDGVGGVNISGGTAPYTVVWSPGGTQSNLPAGVFNINNLVEGNYAVTVTDANGCNIECDFFISSAVCETKLGTMSNTQLSLCGSGCLTANYDALGQFLDADDVLQFVLHTGSSNKIVGEIARNSTPTFCFNAATMSYGTVYYISAVAGNNDGTGNVNLADICTVVSFGTPIVFKQQPVASANAPAPITCVVSQVSVSGSSSVPGSVFQWTASAGGSIVGNANQATIQAGSQGTYILIVNASGCADTTSVFVDDIRNKPQAIILANPDDVLDCTISEIILSGIVQGTSNANTVWVSGGQIYSNNNPVPVTQPGEYTFIVVDTLTFCTDTAHIEIGEDYAYPPISFDPPPTLTCKDTLVQLTGGSPFPGIEFAWATISGSDTTIIGTGPSIFVSAPGVYYFIGTDPNNSCRNFVAATVNTNLTPPTANAGTGFVVSCFENEVNSLNGSASFGSAGLTYHWTTANGNIVSGENTAKPIIDQAGVYVLIVTDLGNGCTDTDQVTIITDGPVAQTLVFQPPCFGDKGSIFVQGVSGGVPPYVYSYDNGTSFSAQSSYTNLQPGAYNIVVQDANGCEYEVLETIEQPVEFDVIVEPQVTVQLGEDYQLETQINVPVDDISSVTWTPALGLSCTDCLDPVLSPVHSAVYKVTVVTKNGCKDSGTILIKVEKSGGVYVPNVFSPNNDGVNDVFMVFADPVTVTKVKSFLVFSRWGETVYQYYNFEPNNPAFGWDGTHRGEAMNPAVFTWFAEVEFVNGQTELFEGDVILMK